MSEEHEHGDINVNHEGVDMEVYVTVELVRSALTVVSWNLHDPGKFPDDDPTIKKCKDFLHAWLDRKQPTLTSIREMPRL